MATLRRLAVALATAGTAVGGVLVTRAQGGLGNKELGQGGRDSGHLDPVEYGKTFDVGVIGGGIVGLATARELQLRHPHLRIVVFEKGSQVAEQQTGHNSGVVHSGVYYKPGSLRALLCTKGNALMYNYCEEHGIPTKRCGKLIVAVEEEEVPRLEGIFENGKQNKVPGLQWIEQGDIRHFEPHCKGVAAVYCPSTGIVDYAQVARTMAQEFEGLGGTILTSCKVVDLTGPAGEAADFGNGVRVHTQDHGNGFICAHIVSCVGAYSDKIAVMTGCAETPKMIGVRGEYLVLKPEKRHLVKGNIYPVPDPRVPFLGVHFTPRIDGSLWLGPNAVPAFAREGYSYSTINWGELWDAVSYIGYLRLALANADFGLRELYRSIRTAAQVKQLQRYIPELTLDDVEPGPAGVRAIALDEDGNLVKDFVFDSGTATAKGRVIHVRNAPSPAATSSLAIAEMVANRAQEEFKLPGSIQMPH